MCRVDMLLDKALKRIRVNLRKEFKYKKRCINRNKLYQKRIKQGRKI
ncbi:hypothetical protein [Clostridium tetani]|nr:hypothetical protein [Clostridium tetani]